MSALSTPALPSVGLVRQTRPPRGASAGEKPSLEQRLRHHCCHPAYAPYQKEAAWVHTCELALGMVPRDVIPVLDMLERAALAR